MKNIPILITFLIMIFSISTVTVSCSDDSDSEADTGFVTDVDGNIYKTIKIGDQWWMAENLKTKRYKNGDSIEFISTGRADTSWSNLTTGAYCQLGNDFGLLYNYYAITDARKIVPEGWHIPSDTEWMQLEQYLGMQISEISKLNWRGQDEGNKLKIDGGDTKYWAKSSDVYLIAGTNESGFSALGGACRIFNGEWGDLTHTAFWWTSTFENQSAYYRGLDYNKTNVFRYIGEFSNGFSIRCVKNL